jgi:GNAT superfamily N-acetyltransferase
MDTVVELWIRSGPPELDHLRRAARSEGLGIVERTYVEWVDGTNRFDGHGEVFVVAKSSGQIVGMCGLNVDPFVADPSVGRLRHLYVAPEHRRRGIGRRLVGACLELARDRFTRVRLRTFDPDAARFYASLGFTPLAEDSATHGWTVRPPHAHEQSKMDRRRPTRRD